jgi:RNA polymerase sigma-70 factor, ECF subfamily
MSQSAGSRRSKNGTDPNNGSILESMLGRVTDVFEQHRSLLFGIAYRMIGTVPEAEDAVQEAFLRWQGSTKTEIISSPRAFLVTIVSRICLDHLRSARTRREQYVGQWLPEPVLTNNSGDAVSNLKMRDSLSIAFLLLLQRLTPAERAVFVLREVFDLDFEQIGDIIKKSEINCRQILRRARKYAAESRARFEASPQQRDTLLREFLLATASGNLEQLVGLLADDVAFYSDGGGTAPAVPNVVVGVDKVGRLLLGALKKFVPSDVTRHAIEANGHPAIASYAQGKPRSLTCLDIYDGRIKNIYLITTSTKLHCLSNPCCPVFQLESL